MKRFRSQLILACGLVLVLGAANVASADGVLTISSEGLPPPSGSSDNLAYPQPIGDVTDRPFDTTGANHDGPHYCMYSPNLWYCYTASCTGDVAVSLAGSSYDTMLAVWEGCDPDLDFADMIQCNDDAAGTPQSEIVFDAVAGNQYLIEVGGYNLETGQGLLSISCGGVTPPPSSKDDCENAKEIGDVTDLSFDTTDATFDGSGLCMTSPNIWYCYTATCTGNVTVDLAGSSFDTMLAVYDGCECYPTSDDLIECNDDAGAGYQSAVTFAAIADNQYLIEVGGYGTEKGEGLISISCGGVTPPPSSKDDCENAKAIGDVEDLSFDTTDSTFDGQGVCMTSPNIWYCYTATCTGNVTVSLAGSSYDTMLAIYDGCGCYPTFAANLIECNDDAGNSYQSEITFAAIAGNQYLIEVGGYGSEKGEGLISISCGGVTPPPSSKDDCENAKAIGDVEDLSFDTTDSTFDGQGVCMTSPNIWYCYTATYTGNVTVSLAGSSFDTMLAVYDGCECYPTSDDLIECNDDAGAGYQSAVTFAAVEGNQYLIEVGGYGAEKGEGLLSIKCEGVVIQGKTDLGDASDSTNNYGRLMVAYTAPFSTKANYPTVYDDGSGTGPYGPVHLNDKMVAYLGKTITREIEADTGPDEDGRNNIRPQISSPNVDNGDDSISLSLSLPDCYWTTIDYDVTVVDPDIDLWVNIWLDWNRDGDWDDVVDCPEGPAPEWAVQNQFLFNLPTGLNKITSPAFLPWHPEDGPENIWVRITLSERPWKTGSNPGELGNAGSGPQEKYEIGETEDYYIIPDIACSICKDHNCDGVIDMDDLIFYTAEWLENCP